MMRSAPTLALLAGAAYWGVVWWPFRLLAAAGLDGIWSTLATYAIAVAVGIAAFPRAAKIFTRLPPLAILMGLAIGWSNLAYVLGVVEGQVMRVLFLFYLAPLWTVPLARLLLHEKLDGVGMAVMALAVTGAMVMLWRPEVGAPWPQGRGDWLGLAGGFLFALGNVLVRRLSAMSDAEKSLVIWSGVTLAAAVHLPQSSLLAREALGVLSDQWGLVLGIGATLVLAGLALQHGLSRLPATRAIVILLFELVVAALAAWWIAGERLRLQDWIGGAFIVAATVASAWKPQRIGSE